MSSSQSRGSIDVAGLQENEVHWIHPLTQAVVKIQRIELERDTYYHALRNIARGRGTAAALARAVLEQFNSA